MKKHLFVSGILMFQMAMVSAYANECLPVIEQIDEQFTSTNPLPPEVLKEAQKLRDQGAALCESGSVNEGLVVLNDAKTLLGI